MENYIPDKKYNYLSEAEFISKDKKFSEIQLEVYLPENDKQKIILIIHPDEFQFSEIMNEFKYEIIGYNKFANGEIDSKIKISQAFILQGNTTSFMGNKRQYQIILNAYDLTLTSYRPNLELGQKTDGFFNIIEYFSLSHPKFRSLESDGSVSVSAEEKYKFTLRNGLEINFDTHYVYNQHENSIKTISYPISVAEFTTEINPENINDYLIYIDEFLILLSYAIGNRCVCTGWQAAGFNKIVTYYRRDISIPKKRTKNNRNNYLVEPFELRKFLEKTYPIYSKPEKLELFKNILRTATRRNTVTVETRFLILISTIESIILKFKKEHNNEFILPQKQFNQLRRKIQKTIKENFPEQLDESDNKRLLICEKIAELNRISFGSAFSLFIKEYKLDISDLWILVDDNTNTTLMSIRNKLIHGDIFNELQLNALSVAVTHIQFIVDRAIFLLLAYDIEKSRVSRSYYHHYYREQLKNIEHYKASFK